MACLDAAKMLSASRANDNGRGSVLRANVSRVLIGLALFGTVDSATAQYLPTQPAPPGYPPPAYYGYPAGPPRYPAMYPYGYPPPAITPIRRVRHATRARTILTGPQVLRSHRIAALRSPLCRQNINRSEGRSSYHRGFIGP
jgi:hypothetical protein